MTGNSSYTRALSLLLVALLLPGWVRAQSVPAAEIPLLDQPALLSARAQRAVLLDITRAGERLIAVGERGIILLSDDSGVNWRQASVPATVSLTSVQFVDADHGWAVGHLGVVLHSADGGETWQKQLDGIEAAELALASAERVGDARLLRAAQWLVADGPDKPFLDLYFSDRQHGYIVGAYGLILRTADGGASWQSWIRHVENPDGLNLYAIRAQGDQLFIAGERGLLLRSGDDGRSFQALESPYDGSFFGLLASRGGGLLAYGLRGNAWWSNDRGDSWRQLDTGVKSALADGLELSDGRLVLASQSGELLFSGDEGMNFEHQRTRDGATVASLEQAVDGSLVSVGLGGLSARQNIQAASRP